MIGWRVVADWGTTRLRLWHLNDGGIVGRRQGPGIGDLAETPAQALRAALAQWLAQYRPCGADYALWHAPPRCAGSPIDASPGT